MGNTKENKEKGFQKLKNVQFVASSAKNALFDSRKTNGAFIDNEAMDSEGILAEATGLTGMLLMLEGFSEPVVNKNDLTEAQEMLVDSVEKISNWIDECGFTAEPLVTHKMAKTLFEGENGYIDTITYVMSAMILACRLKNSNKISFDGATENKILEIFAKSFVQLVNSQREDGMWGFRADKKATGALYFSYSASVTIADFFDYILGEIAYTYDELAEEEQEKQKEEIYNSNRWLLLKLDALIKDKIGCGAEQAMYNAREKLRKWLIEECLCALPYIARCHELNNEENRQIRSRLGIWDYTPDRQDENAGYGPYVKYYNLNYVFYLLDMLVASSSDKYFKSFVEKASDEEIAAFKEKCSVYFDEQDIVYYFGDDQSSGCLGDLWKSVIEQAIHSARANYMIAARTGDLFWNKAELQIMWMHEDNSISRIVSKVYNKQTLKDPSIAPMALRSNVMYSYYISEQTDMTVDRLFGDICLERADKTNANTVSGLWDKNSYNLMITERSVEALLDYIDYLVKFEDLSESAETEKVEFQVKSAIDIAIETKIKEYFVSEEGKALLSEAKGSNNNSEDTETQDDGLAMEHFLALIKEINGWNVSKLNQNSNLRMSVTKELTNLVSRLLECVLHKKICDWNDIDNNSNWDSEKENAYANEISKQIDLLIVEMLKDQQLQEPTHTLKYLYNTLKFSDNK